ncbi:hypothetical protein NUW54_g12673 [Trametes sanguinea]|uniref:Uncharacterized protein n=1 Tax=Trametes sanguinea TaxID=158606 RepID=A0ACC1MWX5_9APHY|nr:hypothetical protein NUW54_g12673 [Trametes sanguinea]
MGNRHNISPKKRRLTTGIEDSLQRARNAKKSRTMLVNDENTPPGVAGQSESLHATSSCLSPRSPGHVHETLSTAVLREKSRELEEHLSRLKKEQAATKG